MKNYTKKRKKTKKRTKTKGKIIPQRVIINIDRVYWFLILKEGTSSIQTLDGRELKNHRWPSVCTATNFS